MGMEDKGQPDEAAKLFLQSWSEASNDFEKYLAAYYVARHQKTVPRKLSWLVKSLEHALQIDDDAVRSAFPLLYFAMATCYEEIGDPEKSREYADRANSLLNAPSDRGPFYHGTKADLKEGDLLIPGGNSNYQQELKMNHIYFTALVNGAGLAAELAKGNANPRVYMIDPTGSFENDPNVTDKKFPGNPTRSYRSTAPLRIISEIRDWTRQSPEELQRWRERLANNKGEIIN